MVRAVRLVPCNSLVRLLPRLGSGGMPVPPIFAYQVRWAPVNDSVS